ncbi:LysR family transcriptional regulator [Pusillimonas sp.]|uniref:LysR family transcriptional regulator n=1 Tax=Pusillimonas sp. TaxID=3040095 RepID=UPI0037C52972
MKTDLNLLRVFLAVHEAGNVTAAAARLGISQPAASAALGRLRRALGDPLFVRHGQRMRATPLAQGILGKTREVIDVIDHEILAPATFDPARYVGELVICLSEIGEVVLLPAIYRMLRERAPGLKLKTFSLGPDELDQAMYEGRIDMAVGYFPDLTGANIYQQRLFSHVLACMVRSDHAISGPRMTMTQFKKAEHLLVRDGSRTMEMYERYIQAQGIQRRVGLQMSHYMSVPGLVEESDMVVVLPRTIAQRFAESWRLKVLAPPVGIPQYDLKQYWHRRFNNDPRLRWLRSVLLELFDGFLAPEPNDAGAAAQGRTLGGDRPAKGSRRGSVRKR